MQHIEHFQSSINKHDIQAMECLSAPSDFCHKAQYVFAMPEINLQELRKSISTICNNSWVKGKKKLIIAGDYDLHLAIKSVFHSLRIYDYGFQIATTGKIYNFKSMNFVLEDLKILSEQYQRNDLCEKIEQKYKKVFNEKATLFKSVAPKSLEEVTKKSELTKILNTYLGTVDKNLLDEILLLFQK